MEFATIGTKFREIYKGRSTTYLKNRWLKNQELGGYCQKNITQKEKSLSCA
jgi:hypothetical protein